MTWRKSGLRVLLIAIAVSPVLVGCRQPGVGTAPAERQAGDVDIGLRRGVSWTTFLLRRGKISGSTASLEIRKGRIVGFLDGGAVRLSAKSDEVSGSVGGGLENQGRGIGDDPRAERSPSNTGGRVQVDIEEYDGKLDIGGTWNDDRVHFEITPETLKGTIRGRALGQCQYVLDKIDGNGVRSGTSICQGLPEQTMLEFPKVVENWLTRGEAVAVLMALLSSAPRTSTDVPGGLR
jgi:hypothetical protein